MYIINNLESFLNEIKRITCEKFIEANNTVEDSFSNKINEIKDVNSLIDNKEIENIIIPMLNKKNKNGKYLVSKKKLYSIIESINNRLVSNSINKLVKEEILESAFDNDLNDFVFWIKKT